MEPELSKSGWKRALANRSFWVVVTILAVTASLHYFRTSLLPASVNTFLTRHAADRILFLLPITIVTYAFGLKGGLITLATIVVAMLPRAIWISASPVDALVETVAAAGVGYFIIRIIDAQAREKVLRQEADARQLQIQQRLNEVAEQITSELELDRVLTKVIQVAEELTGAGGGGIALFDRERENIRYPYLHNLPQELAEVSFSREEGVAGEVMSTGSPVIVGDYQTYPSVIQAFAETGLTSVVAVPIVSGDRVFGALSLVSTDKAKRFSDSDIAILTSIGRQAGIAIENARLYDRIRFYARQITRAQEDERKRVARELHDETVQMLVALSRRLESLTMLPEPLPETAVERLAALQELVSTTLQGVRYFIQDLRPPTLDHLGLVATIEGLTNDLTDDGIETGLTVAGEVRRLQPEEELVLFRIVQEALSNVRRHSKASHALVQIRFHPDSVRVTVQDDGVGFDAPAQMDDLVSTGKLGLTGMHERARMLGGTLIVQSDPDEGTVIAIEVPTQSAGSGDVS
ncbi:MAG: GAF domain-containing sensor histidine kinase [Anaerolineae bacterium]|nr:GAF domain-containing sensor histidine kinase [Anaerolineae bacterium]